MSIDVLRQTLTTTVNQSELVAMLRDGLVRHSIPEVQVIDTRTFDGLVAFMELPEVHRLITIELPKEVSMDLPISQVDIQNFLNATQFIRSHAASSYNGEVVLDEPTAELWCRALGMCLRLNAKLNAES